MKRTILMLVLLIGCLPLEAASTIQSLNKQFIGFRKDITLVKKCLTNSAQCTSFEKEKARNIITNLTVKTAALIGALSIGFAAGVWIGKRYHTGPDYLAKSDSPSSSFFQSSRPSVDTTGQTTSYCLMPLPLSESGGWSDISQKLQDHNMEEDCAKPELILFGYLPGSRFDPDFLEKQLQNTPLEKSETPKAVLVLGPEPSRGSWPEKTKQGYRIIPVYLDLSTSTPLLESVEQAVKTIKELLTNKI
jgi:hypothetical protein